MSAVFRRNNFNCFNSNLMDFLIKNYMKIQKNDSNQNKILDILFSNQDDNINIIKDINTIKFETEIPFNTIDTLNIKIDNIYVKMENTLNGVFVTIFVYDMLNNISKILNPNFILINNY